MAKTVSIDEAVERAKQAQDQKIETIRTLAQKRQEVVDVHERFAEELKRAEVEDLHAYQLALKAGWTAADLKKIGFDEPSKKRSPRRRKAAPESSKDAAQSTPVAER